MTNALLDLAHKYASERRVPPETIAKEILHYEILYALIESGAASKVVFQGGTCLRLCHQGNRYSEDLDFAGGANFNPEHITEFTELLRTTIANTYGLSLDVRQRHVENEHVPLDKFSIKVALPRDDRSLPQKQVINIEIAAVDSHDPELSAVQVNYPHFPDRLKSMFLKTESLDEIFADKLIAAGARPYVKHRDIWDIKFLLDQGAMLRLDFVEQKIIDYGIDRQSFLDSLDSRVTLLQTSDARRAFQVEMTRFVDSRVAASLADDVLVGKFMARPVGVIASALQSLSASPPVASQGWVPDDEGPSP